MIVDKIENAPLYERLSPRLARAFGALKDAALVDGPDGRHAIEGEDIYGLVQRYTSRPPEACNLESHRKYIDVQFVVRGTEIIRHAHRDALEEREPYDPARDRVFYRPCDGMSELRLGAGMFAVFFPHDAHMPCMQADAPAEVHKVVVKVRVDP